MNARRLILVLGWLTACRSSEPSGASDSRAAAATPPVAQPSPGSPEAPAPPRPAPNSVRTPAARDITVPPPDVDVHVINGRNILSARVDEPAERAPANPQAGDAPGLVRVTFWTTPDGLKLPEPRRFEGALADLDLGIGDLPMLAPGEKRRLWIPGPTGMATLDVELLAAAPAKTTAPAPKNSASAAPR